MNSSLRYRFNCFIRVHSCLFAVRVLCVQYYYPSTSCFLCTFFCRDIFKNPRRSAECEESVVLLHKPSAFSAPPRGKFFICFGCGFAALSIPWLKLCVFRGFKWFSPEIPADEIVERPAGCQTQSHPATRSRCSTRHTAARTPVAMPREQYQ